MNSWVIASERNPNKNSKYSLENSKYDKGKSDIGNKSIRYGETSSNDVKISKE